MALFAFWVLLFFIFGSVGSAFNGARFAESMFCGFLCAGAFVLFLGFIVVLDAALNILI